MGGATRRLSATALATAALAVGAARAQPPSSAPVTLAEALDYARTHYPSVRAALAQKVAADRDVDVAKTAYLPQVNLLYQINRATLNNITGVLLPQSVIPSQSGPVLPSSSQSAWSSGAGALVSWRPFDFGYRAAKVDAARAAEAAAVQSAALSELDVLSATSDAYMNLAAAQSLAATAEANQARLRAFASAVHALVDNTLRPGVDAQQADAAEGLAETALISARANVENQKAVLAALIDRRPGAVAIDAAPLRGLPPDAAGGPAPSLDAHPAAQFAQARVRQQSAEVDAAGRQYAPQFDVVGSAYSRGSGKTPSGAYPGGDAGLGPGVSNWAVGLQVTLPLGSYPMLHAEQAGQKARLQAEQARYDQTLDELNVRLDQARTNLDSARAIAKVTPVALEAARQSEAQQRARFQSGLATVVDVTAAEAALAQAESQDSIARLNVWRALAALGAAEGDMAPFRRLLAPPQ
ncbi:MAG: TolC family protein [Caulobacteraceae bacterium]